MPIIVLLNSDVIDVYKNDLDLYINERLLDFLTIDVIITCTFSSVCVSFLEEKFSVDRNSEG